MSAKNQAPALYEMIQKATKADLEQIDQEIESKEDVARKYIGEIDRLRRLRKTIDILVNGKPERKKKPGKAAPPPGQGASVSDRRAKIAKLLADCGAMKPARIANELETSQANVAYALSCSYFAVTPNGHVLTPEGRQQFLES